MSLQMKSPAVACGFMWFWGLQDVPQWRRGILLGIKGDWVHPVSRDAHSCDL